MPAWSVILAMVDGPTPPLQESSLQVAVTPGAPVGIWLLTNGVGHAVCTEITVSSVEPVPAAHVRIE